MIQPPLYLLIKDITPQELVKFLKKVMLLKVRFIIIFPRGKKQLAQEALQKTAEKISTEILDVLAKASTPLEGLQQHLIYMHKRLKKIYFNQMFP